MKSFFAYTFITLMLLLLTTCKKESARKGNLNITGVTSHNKEFVHVELSSGKTSSFKIGDFLLASTFYDPLTNGFGYVDIQSNLNIVDTATGFLIKQFVLPGPVSQVVITSENVLIGQYFNFTRDTNYVIKFDLSNGLLLAKNAVNFGGGIHYCSHFYNEAQDLYVLLTIDTTLISIDPDNGNIVSSVKINTPIVNTVYDGVNNRLIGLSYSFVTNTNYIETIDVTTGNLLSKVEIKDRNDYFLCVQDYDPATDCYILVNAKLQILFTDINNGETTDSYQLYSPLYELNFWKSF